MPPTICGSVASRQPTGSALAMLKSKCPTAFVPALSRSCAAALRPTPRRIRLKLSRFIGVDRADDVSAQGHPPFRNVAKEFRLIARRNQDGAALPVGDAQPIQGEGGA